MITIDQATKIVELSKTLKYVDDTLEELAASDGVNEYVTVEIKRPGRSPVIYKAYVKDELVAHTVARIVRTAFGTRRAGCVAELYRLGVVLP